MINFFVMDVDGTLTDGTIYIGNNGECIKCFNIKDGLGITKLIKETSIQPVLLTGRKSDINLIRANELGIRLVYQGISNKCEILEQLGDYNCIAYIGDDVNDMPCMLKIKGKGYIGCPNDADPSIKNICDFVSTKNGGKGAVREFIDWIIEKNK